MFYFFGLITLAPLPMHSHEFFKLLLGQDLLCFENARKPVFNRLLVKLRQLFCVVPIGKTFSPPCFDN
jgi:hypothetical protein